MAGRQSDFDDDEDGFEPRNDLLDIIPDRLSEDMPMDDEPRRGRSILMGTALVGIAVAGAAAWFLFMGDSGSSTEGPVAAPTIPADSNPYKIRPANPGGMQVPNQDKTVYERLDPATDEGTEGETGERLLPEPPMPASPSILSVPSSEPPASQTATVPETAAQPSADRTTPPPAPTLGNGQMPSLGLTRPSGLTEQQAETPATPAPAAAPAPAPVPAKPAPVAAAPAPAPTPALAAPAAAPAATTGPFTIQLAALRDEVSARKMWKDTQTKYPALLGGLSLVIEKADLGQKGTFYRVRGTGLPSEARAREVCAALSKDKVGCLFVGK
jgi:hypothetical protein